MAPKFKHRFRLLLRRDQSEAHGIRTRNMCHLVDSRDKGPMPINKLHQTYVIYIIMIYIYILISILLHSSYVISRLISGKATSNSMDPFPWLGVVLDLNPLWRALLVHAALLLSRISNVMITFYTVCSSVLLSINLLTLYLCCLWRKEVDSLDLHHSFSFTHCEHT